MSAQNYLPPSISWLFLSVLSLFSIGCEDSSPSHHQIPPDRSANPLPNIIIIYTDDQGYADIGANRQVTDIVTPHIDSLASNGVRMTNGYVTAPQCAPSRAALMTGMYQQRFGLDDNGKSPMPLGVSTIAEYLRQAGYRTGMSGKWNLEINGTSKEWIAANRPPGASSDWPGWNIKELFLPMKRGFDDSFAGYINTFYGNMDVNWLGHPSNVIVRFGDRIDMVNQVAVNFIEHYNAIPFFLYVAPYAPHVPLAASRKYVEMFPEDMPIRRRYALAMMAAIDAGVGRIVETLKKYALLENTLIFYLSDNGAPLGITMDDLGIANKDGKWNGSLNTPMNGEKGMLTEGGIRVPYIAHWPARIPPGSIVDEPVSSLDAIYTALEAAGVDASILSRLDGVDLMPAIHQDGEYLNQRPLFWRFWHQSAIRLGNMKLLRLTSGEEYLFDLSNPEFATFNLIDADPTLADALRTRLNDWEATLALPNLTNPVGLQENEFFDFYIR